MEMSILTYFINLFWPVGALNLANMAKNESIVNTHPISIRSKFELDCM